MKRPLVLAAVTLFVTTTLRAELVHQFKDPTFSGQGWASQVLTMEQMRQSALANRESKAAAEKSAADAAAANTPLARFMNLFTGQVYSQLATQLTNNLFKDCKECKTGNFMVTETQQIVWTKDTVNNVVTLSVYDGKIVDKVFVPNAIYTQQIVVPIASFSF